METAGDRWINTRDATLVLCYVIMSFQIFSLFFFATMFD